MGNDLYERAKALAVGLDRKRIGFCGHIFPGSHYNPLRRFLAECDEKMEERLGGQAKGGRATWSKTRAPAQKSKWLAIDTEILAICEKTSKISQEDLADQTLDALTDKGLRTAARKTITSRISKWENNGRSPLINKPLPRHKLK
jgi:hypothetical protein